MAVTGRELQKAQEFAKKHEIPKFYNSYETLASDSQVDVVYIGITTHCHYEATKVFLNAGKSVLCEKPLGMNLKQTEEMIALAQSKKLFLMEAIFSLLVGHNHSFIIRSYGTSFSVSFVNTSQI